MGPTVPMDVHERDKDNEGSDEDSDEVFPDKTSKGKNKKKRERTEAETVTPVKKKAKKSPGNAPTKKTARSVKNRKAGGKAKLNAECSNLGEIKENCIVCVDKSTDRTNVATVSENGHVWLSLCEEFFGILKDNEVMKEVKEVIRRAKTKKI